MDPMQSPQAPSDNSPGTPHVSTAVSTIVFVSIIAVLMMLGLYCTATRRRSIADARLRLVRHVRSSMSSRLMHQPANVSLPIRKYAKEEMGGDDRATEDCPVCLVEFEEGEEVKVVEPGCEHVFHPVCIDRWLVRRNTCPVCRLLLIGEETYSVEEWGEGDMEVNVTEGGEGEVVVNVESVEVNMEGEGEGEVVVNVESEDVNMEGEGEGEGEVVVNVESDVLSRDMDGREGEGGELGVRMNVESEGAIGSEVEVEVNLRRESKGGEGEFEVEREFGENIKETVPVPVQSTSSDTKMIDDDSSQGESNRKRLEHIEIEVERDGEDS